MIAITAYIPKGASGDSAALTIIVVVAFVFGALLYALWPFVRRAKR